ncbi:carbonic anhydrase [Xanthomonas melonis]|uniref:Carbonic anhydrase n=1 Tax=Xanthomonas melonis TaxID=56456 RepID=A0A2S7DE20_9XANT|nr:carbonic anhydrase family protein [Xanthomonas melonis]MCC4600460.1 carbonic anhydrase family protein [Xanthomonas melonis]PPU72047.1 carbonic anhydrase [Xanthomonas melonis]
MPSSLSSLLRRVSPACLCLMAGWGAVATAQTQLPASAPVQAHETAPHDAHEWGYTGPEGAEHWADLAKENALCGNGQQNSPIDLKAAIDANLGSLLLHYGAVPLVVNNTGHSIQLDLHDGGSMSTGGKQYQAMQLHFHHPSEHLLNGRRFPMEAHIVHQGPDGTLGVLAIFFETGKANPAFQRVLDAMPKDKHQIQRVADATVRASDFLPTDRRNFFRYEGSLTTPPCSETVDWVVLAQPVQVSEEQINAFERVYPFNARPLQPLDRRFLLKSH